VLALLGSAMSPALANTDAPEQPTFYRDVLPILQANCQECHRPAGANFGGMRAPMALISFDDTRPWARSIARQVEARDMPPWDAAARHNGVFANERVLTDVEIQTLVRWAGTGAPAGDPREAPPPRDLTAVDGWLIGEPDLVVRMPDPTASPTRSKTSTPLSRWT
jgi:hypothetical protein